MHIYILLLRLMLCLCCVGWPAEENGGRIQEAQEGGRSGVPFTGVGPDGTENALGGVQHTGSRIFTGIDHKAEEICWVVWCLYILELKGTHSDCASSCNSYYTPVNHPVCTTVCADLFPAGNLFFLRQWRTILAHGVYHHETTCCVHSWPLYVLDLWPYMWAWGYPFWILLTVFISFSVKNVIYYR